MGDYNRVDIVRDEDAAPSLEQEAQEMEQQLGEPEAPQEGQVESFAEERPEWLPEKFDSPEALAAAYASLQSEFGRLKNESEMEEGAIQIEPLSVEDMQPFTEEFEQTGDISDASRQAIADRGLPRSMVDRYVEGLKATTAMEMMQVYQSVGGEDRYNDMISWAADNLSPEESEAFNSVVMQGDTNTVLFTVQNLAARWENSGAAPRPELLQGDTGVGDATGSFQSLAQLTEAMRDPRYKKDPAYRASVENKLKQSQIL